MKIVRNKKVPCKFGDLEWGDVFVTNKESLDPIIWMKCDAGAGAAVSLSSGHVNFNFSAESDVVPVVDATLTGEY